MWTQVLKARKLKGYQFHRQRPVLKYIADFFCKELNLIIELDGITHEEKRDDDIIRQNELEKHGYNVIRFPDIEIINYLDSVRDSLETWIESYEIEHPELLKYKERRRRASP
jgi:very-short-patch-repair endonuclease